ncbi:RES family NAD+ phosphorylase [Ornithinimicrobium murale]|uniref:RES family NAD+ phosphorylase n=1 Tax=Ornithinimicrobium murale TaxID=1050153 RepID=UPI0013B424A0|nr:RES family NAD+ phosphorylase [Ornithinimicrobium murale]
MPLSVTAQDVRLWSNQLLRIAPTTTTHALPFGSLRTYGPVPGSRWDPHPAGAPTVHPPRWGVLYTSSTLTAACAETSQRTRTIDRRTGAPAVTTWTPTRPLRLLDLTAGSTWLIRHQASAALTTRPAPHCQAWAHHIVASLDEQIDGLYVPSAWTGTNVVLFGPAADAFPPAPTHRVPLDDPALFPVLQRVAAQIGCTLI